MMARGRREEMHRVIEVAPGILIDDGLYKHFTEFLSDSEVRAMFESIRTPPSRYYVRVNTLKANPRDLVHSMRAKGVEVYADEYVEEAIWFPVRGPFNVPSARKIVVADKYASESVYMGANLYAPGVLSAKGVVKGDEVNVVSPTGEVVAYGIAEMGEDEIITRRRGLAVRVEVSRYKLPKVRELEEFAKGLIYDQSYPAILTSRILDPREGELIVDANAAPGGKTSHIVQLTRCGAEVVAIDRGNRKIQVLVENLRRLGMEGCARVRLGDSRYLGEDFPDLVGRVDRILVDPPCSSIGVRPKLYDRKTMDYVTSLASYQRQFIKSAQAVLKRGGLLVYSTCTLTMLENELVVDFATSLGFDVEPIELKVAGPGAGFEWSERVRRFYPHLHDTPGYFIAALRKA